MRKTNKLRTAVTAAAAAVTFATGSASGASLSGNFSVSGAFLPMFDQTTIGDLLTATAIDFMDGVTPSPGTPGPITVTNATGDFASLIPAGTPGTAADFSFGALGFGGFPTPPIVGFQQIGAGPLVTVDLLNIHVIAQNDAFLNLQGATVVHASQYDPTAGTYTFGGRVDGTTSRFSFSAVNSVPEPLSLALVGIGLLGIAAVRRRA